MRAIAVFCGLLYTGSALVLSSSSSSRCGPRAAPRAASPDDGAEIHDVETRKMNPSTGIPSLKELDDMLGYGDGDGDGDGGGGGEKKRNPNIPSLEMIEAMIDADIYTLEREYDETEWFDTDYYGSVDTDWEEIGEVDDIVVSRDGRIVGLVLIWGARGIQPTHL